MTQKIQKTLVIEHEASQQSTIIDCQLEIKQKKVDLTPILEQYCSLQ
jgi:hypothetical protein